MVNLSFHTIWSTTFYRLFYPYRNLPTPTSSVPYPDPPLPYPTVVTAPYPDPTLAVPYPYRAYHNRTLPRLSMVDIDYSKLPPKEWPFELFTPNSTATPYRTCHHYTVYTW